MARQNSPVSTGPRPVDSSVSHSANPTGTSTRFTPRFRSALAARRSRRGLHGSGISTRRMGISRTRSGENCIRRDLFCPTAICPILIRFTSGQNMRRPADYTADVS